MHTTTLRNCSLPPGRKTPGAAHTRYLQIALLLLLPLMAISSRSSGQTTLQRGELVISAFSAVTTDSFQFAAWVPMTNNTQIRFTDCSFNSSGSATAAGNIRAQEQVITWTNNTGSTIAAGTKIRITNGGTAGISASIGSVSVYDNAGVASTMNLTNSPGDQIFAYQSTNASAASDFSPVNSVTATFSSNCNILFGFTWVGGSTGLGWQTTGTSSATNSYRPSELNNAAYNAVIGTTSVTAQSGTYTGSTSGQSAFTNYSTMVTNFGNWTSTASTSAPQTFVTTPFTITFSNTAPIFANGITTLTVCENSTATSINSLLTVSDVDASQTETWTVTSPPSHGTLGGFPATSASGSASITPSGLTYTPTAGYDGSDAFTVQVSDGFTTASRTINVTVTPLPVIAPITGGSALCTGSTLALSTTTTGGTWSSSPSSAFIDANGVLTGITQGVTTVTYTKTVSGCTNTATANVTVNLTPTAYNLSSGAAACQSVGVPVTLASSQLGITYQLYSGSTPVGSPVAGTGNSISFGTITTNGNYTATGTNDVTGCVKNMLGSAAVMIFTNPTISLGSATPVIQGNTSTTVSYTQTGSPTQYSIIWNTAAINAGFSNVSSASLSGGTITIAIPSNVAAGTYSANLVASTGLCQSTSVPLSVTVNAANTTPSFSLSAPQSLTVCKNAGDANIASLLHVSDADAGQTLTWTVQSPATNGTVTLTGATASSGSTNVTPGGTLTYTPATGYSGADAFTIRVSDGSATADMVVNVTVNAVISNTIINPVSCFGNNNGSIYVMPSGGTAPYTIDWGGGIITQNRTFLAPGNYSATITDNVGCTAVVNATITQPALLNGSVAVTDANCFGANNGAIDLTVTGGTAPYTFSWDGGVTTEDITGLSAGTYLVLITDAKNCTAVAYGTINQPTAIIPVTSVTNVSCFGANTGAIDLTVTGGAAPYTFNWGGGITTEDRTGLPAGNYSVTITDNTGCTSTAAAPVTQPAAALSGAVQVVNGTCYGYANGSMSVAPSGGTAPYSVDWGGGIVLTATSSLPAIRSLVPAGSYAATITDNKGCPFVVNATVTEPALVSGSVVVTDVSCNSGSNGDIDLTAAGGTSPYTYNWGNGVTTEDRSGLAAGSYSVTITDNNGCTAVVNASVSEPSAALSSSTSVTNVTCFGGTNGAIDVTAAGGTAPYTYNWGGGITTEDRSGLAAGSYSVTITDHKGCTSIANATVAQPSSLPTVNAGNDIAICAGGTVTLTGAGTATSYSWNNGVNNGVAFTPSATATYTVTGTDGNNCTNTDQVVVTVNALPTVNAGSDTTMCPGLYLILSGSGATSYSWNNGAVNGAVFYPSATTTYTVTGTDGNNCSNTDQIVVTVLPAPGITMSTPSATTYQGSNSVNLTYSAATATEYVIFWNIDAANEGFMDVSTLAPGTVAGGVIAVPVSTIAPPGIYNAVLQGYNSVTGCFGSYINIEITINASTAPTFTLTSPQTVNICENASATSIVSLLHVSDIDPTETLTWTVPVTPQHGLLVIANANAASGGTDITPGGVIAYLVNSSYDGPDSAVIRVSDGTSTADMIVHFNVHNLPAVDAGTDQSVCTGGSVTLSGSGATSYTWDNSVSNGVAFAPSATGTYTVTGTDGNGCVNTDQVNVIVNSLPTVDAGTDAAVCNGTSVTLSGAGATSYSWNNGVTNGVSFVPTATATYTVTGTDGNNCTNTDQVTITVNNKPVLTPSQLNVACNGGTTGAASVSVTGASPFTFSWTGVTNTTNTVSGLSAGLYSVEVIDNNGCGIMHDFTITQPTALSATIMGSTNVTCFGGNNGATSVNVTGGTTPYTYSWDNSVGTAALTSLTAGTYVATVTDGNGCTATATATITQPSSLPAVNAGTDVAVCAGASVTLSGSGAITYSWNNGVTNGLSFVPSATATYTVTGTDGIGCTNTDQVTVTVNALPTISAGVDADICAGQGIMLTGAGNATSYSWDNGVTDGISFVPSSTATYTVTGTDGNGCVNTDAVIITVKPLPTVSAGSDVATCIGGSVTLTASGSASSYSWNNGITDGMAFAPTASGTYTVTGTGINGCTNTDAAVVTVNALPTVSAGTDFAVCAGQTASLSGSGATTYNWNNSITNGVAFNPAVTDVYTVTGTDGNGCVNTDQVTVTVNALPTVSAGADVAVCSGGSVTLSGSGASTYSWSNGVVDGVAFMPVVNYLYSVTGTDGNGCTNTDQVMVTVNTLPIVHAGADAAVCIGGTVTLSGSNAGSYSWNNGVMDGVAFAPTSTMTYTVTGTDGNGCSNTDDVTITVNALPNVSAGADGAVCIGSNISLNGTGATSYTWNNGVTDGVSFTAMTTTTYTVTGTDGNGCVNTDDITVTVNALPTVNAGTDQTICGGSSATLSGSGASSYSWTGGVVNGVAFTPTATATYTVTGTDGNGCSNTDNVTVTLHIPAITSNDVNVCKGDTVTLTAPAGTGYSWKKGNAKIGGQTTNTLKITAIGTANYSVTYTDPVCGKITTAPVTVVINKLPAKPKITNGTVACIGGTMTVSASAGYASYAWTLNGSPMTETTPDVIADTSGDYTVIVTDTNGCVSPVSAVKKIKFKPLPSSVIKIQKVFPNGSIRLMAATGAAYQWYYNGNPMAGVTTRYNTITQTGDYRLFIVGQNGCLNTSADTNIVVNYTGNKLSAAEIFALNNEVEEGDNEETVLETATEVVSISPNPSSGIFHINSTELLKAVVVDLQGKPVAEKNNATEVDLTEQPSGIYLVQLYNSQGKLVKTEKLNKQ